MCNIISQHTPGVEKLRSGSNNFSGGRGDATNVSLFVGEKRVTIKSTKSAAANPLLAFIQLLCPHW